jgi:hypothetical protein
VVGSRATHQDPLPNLHGGIIPIPRLSTDDHYRKRIKFRGPGYFRRPSHENKEGIFVGLITDENTEYFFGPGAIFVGRPTKILNIFPSAS